MVNKNYARGKAKDVQCAKDLRELGFWAQESYASKGAFDVIAVAPEGLVRLIQVKRSKRNIVKIKSVAHQYREDIERLLEIPFLPAHVHREIWLWIDKQGKAGERGYQPAGWRIFLIDEIGELKEIT